MQIPDFTGFYGFWRCVPRRSYTRGYAWSHSLALRVLDFFAWCSLVPGAVLPGAYLLLFPVCLVPVSSRGCLVDCLLLWAVVWWIVSCFGRLPAELSSALGGGLLRCLLPLGVACRAVSCLREWSAELSPALCGCLWRCLLLSSGAC